jgi:hypothetical protein
MRRIAVLLVSAMLAVTAAAPIAAAGPAQGGPHSGFVGDFNVVGAFAPEYGGDPAHILIGRGRVVARLAEPTDQRLVAGSLDFYGAAGASLREAHVQFAMAWFSTPDNLTVALGEGVECRYTGPNEAACRQVRVQFIEEPGKPSQLDFSTGADWPYTGETWMVEGGSFELHVAP